MFHLLLGLLGLGGPLALVTYLVGPAKVLAYAKGLPRWVWIAAAIVIAIVGFTIWHGHALGRHDKATRADQQQKDDAAWQKAFDKERQAAEQWRKAAELNAAKIAADERKRNDEENRRIAADAADLLLHGPGKAALNCGPVAAAGLSPLADRPGEAGRPGDVALGPVPDSERPQFIVMPFADAISFAQQHDQFRAEDLTFRADHDAQAKAWEQMRQAAPKVAHP